jgi:hypothetical protein
MLTKNFLDIDPPGVFDDPKAWGVTCTLKTIDTRGAFFYDGTGQLNI